MAGLIIRRCLVTVLLLLAVSFLTFLLIELAPGSAFDRYRANPQISGELIQQLEQRYGLDEPFYEQYVNWLWQLLQGDMGYSFVHKRPVSTLIWDAFGNTVFLMLASILLTWLLALPMGIYCAVHQYSWGDQLFSVLAFVGMSIPNFFLCFLLLYGASIVGGWPLGGMTSIGYGGMSWWQRILDLAQHMAIPVVVISTSAMAGLQRITRGNMLEVLRKQYVTAARARGIPENRVIYVHALRNAINPLITIFGYQFSTLISGAALVEIIVSWPGMGQLMLQAVRSQDQFLVVGVVLASGLLLIGGNLIADILLGMVDPRIKLGETGAQ
jgi:peptide/nickel transport system permease protein